MENQEENKEKKPILAKGPVLPQWKLDRLRDTIYEEIAEIYEDAERFRKSGVSQEEYDEYYKKAVSKANALHEEYAVEARRSDPYAAESLFINFLIFPLAVSPFPGLAQIVLLLIKSIRPGKKIVAFILITVFQLLFLRIILETFWNIKL